ncbi:MAG: DUF6599 family protein [bacterium]
MKKNLSILPGILCLLLCVLSCSDKKQPQSDVISTETNVDTQTFYAAGCLPHDIETPDIKRLGSPNKILPTEADSILGEKAAAYLACNLVGLAEADYQVQDLTVSAEVAQFASPEDAYGFYSGLRPIGVGSDSLGVESFTDGARCYFTHGDMVVTLTVSEQDSAHLAARFLLGREIDNLVPSAASKPTFFMLFPMRDRVPLSERFYSHDFLDISGLDQFYSSVYVSGSDTAVLFLGMDDSGQKFLELKKYAETVGAVDLAPVTLAYEDYSLAFNDPQHGRILAGLVRSKLVGIIGYDSTAYDHLMATWLQGLQ